MKWLKKLFKREKTREIKIETVKEELEEKAKKIKEEIKARLEELKQIKKNTNSALEDLENAQLDEKNPQIVSRVDSNRNSYIQQTKRMMENVKIPEEISREKLKTFLTDSTTAIKEFAERSVKSYQITQFLIGKELAAVAAKIKELTDKLKELEEKTKELKKIEEIEQYIEDIKENKEKKKRAQEEMQVLEKEIEKLKEEKDEKEKEKIDLKESGEHKEYLELKERTEDLLSEGNKLKSEILNLFSPLQKALRKYSKISIDPTTVNKYVQDPYTALLEDKEIKISTILQKIDIKSLDIKEKEKKVKKAIDAISKEILYEIKEKDKLVKEEIKKIKEKISDMDIIQRIEQKEKEIKKISEKIQEKKEDLFKKK